MRNKRIPSVDGITMLLLSSFSLYIFTGSSTALDTITANQSVRDGETLVSDGESFELGFFSPAASSKNRYLGIWYKQKATGTVIWVANRDIPLRDKSGVLKVTEQGILVLLDSTDSEIIWSSNSLRFTQHPVAQLLDTGNLVVKDGNDSNIENFLWQSFDHPCDTLLPGMKLGINKATGLDRYLTSWKSNDDPARGDFTLRLDPGGYPQILLRIGSVVKYRGGQWNGVAFSGRPELKPNAIKIGVVSNHEEVYYTFEVLDNSFLLRAVTSQNGIEQVWTWSDPTQGWLLYRSWPTDDCDKYALCGAYGSCNIGNNPLCGCLSKFVPKVPANWDRTDWSNGCIRRMPLDCGNGDGFLKYSGIKFPDTRNSWYDESMSLEECEMVCSKNCSCMAYANSDTRWGGSGCLLWFGDLIDIREFRPGGQDFYIRMASSELDSVGPQFGSNGKKGNTIIISLALSIGLLLSGLCLISYAWKKKKKMRQLKRKGYIRESKKEDLQLPLFDLATIENATSNFSINNKLGEGGFGPVYKGVLEDGQEIAVKRLSKNSTQGLDEFKNEVSSIAKLQHRNLVKLLGCCIIVEEKMLIYEYMPNKSLDFFIFDQTKRMLLDWAKRFHIINGIAQGLLYLHRDSRLRVIHRDLKASNILLDKELNPKISDFGLAKSFGGNETEVKTNRVIGTYGYMSPEYAINGLYSVKSDVFSFGVLVLEIVSGKRNRGFHHPDHYHNLLGHAWILFKEGRPLELIDSSIRDSCTHSEVLRTIHVGLLCIQQRPGDRPSMSSVVLMLGGESALPQSKHPGFFTEMTPPEADSLPSEHKTYSANVVTITLPEAR